MCGGAKMAQKKTQFRRRPLMQAQGLHLPALSRGLQLVRCGPPQSSSCACLPMAFIARAQRGAGGRGVMGLAGTRCPCTWRCPRTRVPVRFATSPRQRQVCLVQKLPCTICHSLYLLLSAPRARWGRAASTKNEPHPEQDPVLCDLV